MRDVCQWFLVATASIFVLTGCPNQGSVQEEGTEAEWPVLDPSRETDTYVCSPFDPDAGDGSTEPDNQGVLASLYYLAPELPHYETVDDYIEFGTKLEDIDIFFNQLYVPTRPFDRGFATVSGVTLTTPEGDTLYEWFAMDFRGQFHKNSSQAAGDYQIAILSDDGAILEYDSDGDGVNEVLIDNDGWHPTRMGCATQPVNFTADNAYNYRLKYFQGPRYHISLVVMMRPWPSNPDDVNDPLCGSAGNSLFFDSTQDPPEPQSAYNDLLARGWVPLNTGNYSLPATEEENPCNEPAPIISNVKVLNIAKTSVDVVWDTDIPGTSQVIVKNVGTSETFETTMTTTLTTQHAVAVTGLLANTLYTVKAVSASSSGLQSESAELSFRTGR